jgi:hypothetical protein
MTPVSTLLAFGFLSLFAAPAQANSTLFNYSGYNGGVCGASNVCLESGTFGALIGLGTAVAPLAATATTNNATVGGNNIGVGPTSSIVDAGNSNKTWTGPIDFADPLTGTASGTCGAGSCAVPTGTSLTGGGNKKITVTNGTVQNASLVDTAIAQAEAISSFWASQTAVAKTNVGKTGGTTALGVLNAGVQVFSTASLATNTTLTITGNSTTDMVILDVTGNTANTIGGSILLSGGISADQVLINILGNAGTSKILSLNSGTLNVDFIIANDDYTANTTVNGRVFGGDGAVAWNSSFVLNSPGDATPEPSTWILMGAGCGALIYIRKRRK